MITSISMPTRSAARRTLNNFVSSGKSARILDKGAEFKGNTLKGETRWSVMVVITNVTLTNKPVTRSATRSIPFNNNGWDIRKVMTSSNGGWDLYFDSEFIARRETRFAAYTLGVSIANKQRLSMKGLVK